MADDPSSGGVITGGYNFYIGGTLLPRFYEPVALVWPETHCGGNGEPGVERDLCVHILNPEFTRQIIM
eukprot:4009780-Ditylum_brightwellii.AAC.1